MQLPGLRNSPSLAAQHVVPTDSTPPVDEIVETNFSPVEDGAARRKMIAEAAYFRAQQRGFAPGYELEDWLAAENEIVRTWLERGTGTDRDY